MSQLRDDLIAAKALIADEKDWTQHPKSMAPMCAYAAVLVAIDGRNVSRISDRVMETQHFLARFLPEPFANDRHVIAFNDAPGTTHRDIMALFDRAIEAAS